VTDAALHSMLRRFVLCVVVIAVCDAQLAATPGITNTTSGSDDTSPLFVDTNPFSNSRSASLIATFLSGLSGAPYTACHVWRSVTLLTICRQPERGELSASQMPIALTITDDPTTQYYAGSALLAPVFFLAIAAITALASLMFTKTRGASWRRMLIHGRYPQHLLFVFFFVYQTGVSSATTVIALNPDLTSRILYAIPIVAWIAAWLAPCVYLWKAVPQRAVFIRRFRDVSDEAEIEKELHRRLIQLEKENEAAEAEATRLRLEAVQEEERLKRVEEQGGDDAGGSVTAEIGNATFVSGSDALSMKHDPSVALPPPQHSGILMPDGVVRYPGELGASDVEGHDPSASSLHHPRFGRQLFKSLRDLIPEAEEDILMRHTEKYVAASLRADDAEKERLRRATNLVYSKMLASQIQAMAFDDSAVQLLMTGRDRWEDQKPLSSDPDSMRMQTEAEEADDEDVIALAKQAALSVYVPAPIADYLKAKNSVKSRTGFLLMWGGFFRHFKESAYWFAIVEFSLSLVAGVLEGWKPSDASGTSCYVQSSIFLVANGAYFAMLIVLRPYVIPLEMGLVMLSSFLQIIASCFTVVAVVSGNTWGNVGANVMAVACIYLFVLKALLDFFLVIAPLLYSLEAPWPTAKLTSYYFDTGRETSDVSYYERRARFYQSRRSGGGRGGDKSSGVRRSTSSPVKGDGDSTGSVTRSPRRSRAGSFSSVQGGGSPVDGQSVAGTIRPVSPTGSAVGGRRPLGPSSSAMFKNSGGDNHSSSDGPPPQQRSTRVGELQVRTVDDLENEATRYRVIGGRRNAYVGSRGVPEALHPFSMVPLPGIIPLPPRDPDDMTIRRRHAMQAQQRTKKAITTAKFAELFQGDFASDVASNATTNTAANNNTNASVVSVPRLVGPGLAGLTFLKEEHDKEVRVKEQRTAQQKLNLDQLNALGTNDRAPKNSKSSAQSDGSQAAVGSTVAGSRRSNLGDDRRSGTSWGGTERNAAGSSSRHSSSGKNHEDDNQAPDPLTYEDDPDAIMDVLLFSKGAFHPNRLSMPPASPARQSTATNSVPSFAPETLNTSGSSGSPSFSPQPSSVALPQNLHHSAPHMSDEQKRELVSQRLLAMLQSSASSTAARRNLTPHNDGGTPPRFRGAGVYSGSILSAADAPPAASFSPRAASGGRSSPRRVRFLGVQEDFVEL
jgi:hypothetical protein